MPSDEVKVKGLTDLTAAFNNITSIEKDMPEILNGAAEYVYARARRLIPKLRGNALRSLNIRKNTIEAGGAQAPYFGWLDFGGRVGINNSVNRPFMRRGRYIYGVISDSQREIQNIAEKGLKDSIEKSGLEVD